MRRELLIMRIFLAQRGRCLLLWPVLLGGIAGCVSSDNQRFSQDVHQTATKVTVVATKVATAAEIEATAAYGRMQRYLAEKDVLKTFTDAGEHSETEVLAVLHRSRVAQGGGKPGTQAGTQASKPAGTPGGGAAHSLPALPQQYSGSLRWPLDAGIVSSEYGARWGKMHKGIDIAADAGEPVYAIADGDVIYAGDGLRGYGNVVIIQHDRRMTSLYAHNSALKVKQGDKVSKGTLVALLGSTGHSTGPHVHFEIREDDGAVNPRTLLPKSALADVIGPGAAPTLASSAALNARPPRQQR
jgi:murein DD-endopeptidase MepM/ murein hydrolase activator NlpD